MATETSTSKRPKDFDGKVVLITGAASGIGAAIAIEFARHGAIVSLMDLRDLDDTVENCRRVSGAKPFENKILKTTGDLKSNSTRIKFITETVVAFNKIDVLVNCAAKNTEDSMLNTSVDAFDAVMSLSIRSIYHLCTLCIPHLIKTRGNIININISSENMSPNKTIYSIAKAAIEQLTKQLAQDLGNKGVRVNSVNRLEDSPKRPAGPLEAVQCYDEHVANVVVLIASPKGKIITGSNILFDAELATKLR